MSRRRRSYTREFKREAAALVLDGGRTATSVALELDAPKSAVGRWVDEERARRGAPEQPPGQETEQQELARLRKENEQLRKEREILKKATAFFAKESL